MVARNPNKTEARIPTNSRHYKRKTDCAQAPVRGTARLAQKFIPETKTFKEKQGFLGLKDRDDKRPLWQKLTDVYNWLCEKYTIVFKHRSECVDQHEYECLLITHSAISDFTVAAFIYSCCSEVEELPYVHHCFNPMRYAEDLAEGPDKEAFKDIVEKIEKKFISIKKDLRKYIENDAYFLNAQTRSHTIWFLEHFFKNDIEEPDAPTSGKVVFEVQVPDPIPQEVKDAMGQG
jgi:hypothetical protein